MTDKNHSESSFFLLDAFSADDLSRWEQKKDQILRYHWDLYSDFAYERQKNANQLRVALLEATSSPFEFKGWQRQVRYKYCLTPLSPKGSLIEPGGRFNIPDMNPDQIPPFPALYIAEDKETTLQEAGQHKGSISGLSALDLALIKKDSISIIAITGKLGSIIDLTHPTKLKSFINLIKTFTPSKQTLQAAKELKLKSPLAVKSLKKLIDSLLEPNWRAMCMQFDIPANCQIFGQLVANAGIEGILYPSKFTKKKCLAIYPQNFEIESFVAVEGEAPNGVVSRLDSITWPSLKAAL